MAATTIEWSSLHVLHLTDSLFKFCKTSLLRASTGFVGNATAVVSRVEFYKISSVLRNHAKNYLALFSLWARCRNLITINICCSQSGNVVFTFTSFLLVLDDGSATG